MEKEKVDKQIIMTKSEIHKTVKNGIALTLQQIRKQGAYWKLLLNVI
jgi:hypothetical protein